VVMYSKPSTKSGEIVASQGSDGSHRLVSRAGVGRAHQLFGRPRIDYRGAGIRVECTIAGEVILTFHQFGEYRRLRRLFSGPWLVPGGGRRKRG
jgi:hypothetical protein